jgi:hypothetical protein
MTTKPARNPAGSGWNPKVWASGVAGNALTIVADWSDAGGVRSEVAGRDRVAGCGVHPERPWHTGLCDFREKQRKRRVPGRNLGHSGGRPVSVGHDRAAVYAILYGNQVGQR